MDYIEVSKALPGTKRSFKPNSSLLYQGEVPRSGFYITKGIVRSYTLQANGEEQIVAFHGPGDFLPICWLFKKTASSLYFYESVTLTSTVSVLQNDIEVLQKNPAFNSYFTDKLVSDNIAFQMRVTALEQPKAVDKILYTIFYLLHRFGVESGKPGEHKINLKLTHSTIASMIGLTRETTATELNILRRKKILRYDKKIYYINRPLLEKTISEDSFNELLND